MSLVRSLLEVQKELGAVSKDKQNPFFSSNYADINKYIEVVKPVLSKHGIVVLQPLDNINGVPALKTIFMFEGDSLDGTSGRLEFTTPIVFKDNDPQKVGSAITYYRRYALQSALFIEAEDDDANKASGKKAPKAVTNNEDLPF